MSVESRGSLQRRLDPLRDSPFQLIDLLIDQYFRESQRSHNDRLPISSALSPISPCLNCHGEMSDCLDPRKLTKEVRLVCGWAILTNRNEGAVVDLKPKELVGALSSVKACFSPNSRTPWFM
jgi:hypothetical protein